ncbi:uncharacterized protein LOC143432163 [Xylocopa sonorina]|uniref:uncharacterized protein LOC143432163 n=1 Tax=Xylocopa sonorina TaxID=1818115 RepID=UPI00403B16ED
MQLPTFDGTYEIWASFYVVFLSIIDRNENLTPVQKLQYLRSTLTGMAAVCIGCLSTTDANYTDAIGILKGKFDCIRRTASNHCDAIWNIPSPPRDTAEAISEEISHNGTLLLSIIRTKINPNTMF